MRYFLNNTTLVAYSSDASIYAKAPLGIIQVCSENDAINAILDAKNRYFSVTPRGAGTGLAGGAMGAGYILDMGQYRNILKIDPESQTVHTQVGIIYNELNNALKEFGLFFPPDPSSGDSCQIGGMIANNSSGPRSVKYGLTSQFTEELGIVSAKGEKINLQKLIIGSKEMDSFFEKYPEYNKIFELIKNNSGLIKNRWPKLKKNSAGYNLYQVVLDIERGIFNLPALIVGSEGTLALHLDVKLRLLPIPKEKLTIRTYFKSLVSAGSAVDDILKLGPSGLEIVDGSTLNLIGREQNKIPIEAAALLLIEFDEEITQRKKEFESTANNFDLAAPVDYATDPKQATPLWQARRAIVPTLYRHHPKKRPVALIEDIIVPPDKIPSFIEYTSDLFDSYGLTYGLFGHIGDGNLHIRPLFDLSVPEDFELARKIYDTIYDKVISLGGSTTGEHGDGRIRSGLLKKLYG
ncbi:MAG: FAD-binding oxidoreductase, partial [candidate division Zixibacteria bacterium]|nr:FAD-binding oxidoreductase [candidate division Zixibacteria bacterium]